MPNLVKEFRVEVGFYRGPKSPSPAQLELKITPRKIGLSKVICTILYIKQEFDSLVETTRGELSNDLTMFLLINLAK